MRFLPIFLDLQAGPVLLVGAGDLVRAKLRLLLSAGARVRWFAVDGDYESGLDSEAAGRIERAGDPLTADLKGVIAILCAGAGELGETMAKRARDAGIPVNVMDDLAHSTFIFPAIVDRGDVVVAVGTGGTSPVVARRVRAPPARRPPAQTDAGASAGNVGPAEILGAHCRWPDRCIDFVRPRTRGRTSVARDRGSRRFHVRARLRHAGRRGSGCPRPSDREGAARAAGCRRDLL